MPNPFPPRKIINPKTGQERIISSEEQEQMLESGIFFSQPSKPVNQDEQQR